MPLKYNTFSVVAAVENSWSKICGASPCLNVLVGKHLSFSSTARPNLVYVSRGIAMGGIYQYLYPQNQPK